ncbi:MAG: hypothetical protein VKI81_06060, partial [Synechococcaceae cyanobacterium]|nr:hypothetical protein [Synechococcaceae cyanobacterium]
MPRLPFLSLGAAGLAALWWLWPRLRPMLPPAPPAGAPEVITVFVETHERTFGAVDLWRRRPGALLVLQGRPDSLAQSRAYIGGRGVWPGETPGVVALTEGCDTVGQLAALTRWLRPQPRGRVTVVTSSNHLVRSLAIGRILLGAEGWRVEGHAVATHEHRAETRWG